jgi:hypothetical protein
MNDAIPDRGFIDFADKTVTPGEVRIPSTPFIIPPTMASPNVEVYTQYASFLWSVVT